MYVCKARDASVSHFVNVEISLSRILNKHKLQQRLILYILKILKKDMNTLLKVTHS